MGWPGASKCQFNSKLLIALITQTRKCMEPGLAVVQGAQLLGKYLYGIFVVFDLTKL